MRYWLHRISCHADTSGPLLERGFLTVGFSDFAYRGGVGAQNQKRRRSHCRCERAWASETGYARVRDSVKKSCGDTMATPRNGCNASKSLSPLMIWVAPPLTAPIVSVPLGRGI